MNYNDVKAAVEAKRNGTIRTMSYTKTLQTLKDVTDVITKKTTCQVRYGVKYDNIKVIQGYKATHEANEKTGHLQGVEWVDDKHNFVKSSTGKIQLRCTKANGNKSKTIYYKNGVPVDRAEIEPLCRKSEFPTYKEGGTPRMVFNIGIENIDYIK